MKYIINVSVLNGYTGETMSDVSLKQKLGELVTEFFILRSIETRTKKTDNSPYLVLELGYPHGRIWAHVWDNTEDFLSEYGEGDIIKVQGLVEQYKEMTQINIKKIRKAVPTDEVLPENLLPQYPGDLNALKESLENIIESFSNDKLRDLCAEILIISEFSERFTNAPAGKLWHHNYAGGLLEHSVSVAGICMKIAQQYPDVNSDLLCAGALLHDVGKVDAYNIVPYIDYSDEGRLEGHVALGYARIKDAMNKLEDFPCELSKELSHLLLSHHGELSNAAPVVPMTVEAFILHHSDEIDSKVNALQRISKEQDTPRRKWSNYVNLLDRFIYFGETENGE
jgi:3'-5' exoribonuclease